MTQFSDFDSLLSLIFLRCSRTLRFHTGWSIVKLQKSINFRHMKAIVKNRSSLYIKAKLKKRRKYTDG